MTRYGMIAQKYTELVGARPFSIFSQVIEELAANAAWKNCVLAWGDIHYDDNGFFISDEELAA